MKIRLSKKQKRNLVVLCGLALIYFLVFIPVNLRSAADANMLVCSHTDEYTQFSVIQEMINTDIDPQYSLMHFVDTGHYYYGYPFYFFSVLFLLPLKLLSTLSLGINPRIYVLILRQLSPLFTSVSLLMLIYLVTEFRNLFLSVSAFLFLALIPSTFYNNLWWHPDSMLLFFIISTIFCLALDRMKFGPWFLAAAVSCGLAVSLKTAGLFFFLTIPTYIVYARIKKTITTKEIVVKAVLFLGIMILVIILSNPILFFPGKPRAVYETLRLESHRISQKEVTFPLSKFLDHYSVQLKDWYGYWPLYLVSIAFGVINMATEAGKKLLSLLIFTWSVPYIIFLVFFIDRYYHYYFLPALLPLFALIWTPSIWKMLNTRRNLVLPVLLVMLLALQFIGHFPKNINLYVTEQQEEQTCQSLQFFQQMIDVEGFSRDPEEEVLIYHDPLIYLPPDENIQQKIIWGIITYEKIQQSNPEMIILEQRKLERFSTRSIQDNERYGFYQDVLADQVLGYRIVLESDFGIMLKRE